MYSPETLLQIHHLRHEELVARAVRRPLVRPGGRVRAVPGATVAVGRAVREAVTGGRHAVVDLVTRAGTSLGTSLGRRTGATRGPSHDPVCCPA